MNPYFERVLEALPRTDHSLSLSFHPNHLDHWLQKLKVFSSPRQKTASTSDLFSQRVINITQLNHRLCIAFLSPSSSSFGRITSSLCIEEHLRTCRKASPLRGSGLLPLVDSLVRLITGPSLRWPSSLAAITNGRSPTRLLVLYQHQELSLRATQPSRQLKKGTSPS